MYHYQQLAFCTLTCKSHCNVFISSYLATGSVGWGCHFYLIFTIYAEHASQQFSCTISNYRALLPLATGYTAFRPAARGCFYLVELSSSNISRNFEMKWKSSNAVVYATSHFRSSAPSSVFFLPSVCRQQFSLQYDLCSKKHWVYRFPEIADKRRIVIQLDLPLATGSQLAYASIDDFVMVNNVVAICFFLNASLYKLVYLPSITENVFVSFGCHSGPLACFFLLLASLLVLLIMRPSAWA